MSLWLYLGRQANIDHIWQPSLILLFDQDQWNMYLSSYSCQLLTEKETEFIRFRSWISKWEEASFHLSPAQFVPRKTDLHELYEQGSFVFGQCKYQQKKDARVGEEWRWSMYSPVPYLSVTRTECGQKPSLSLGCFLQRANHHLWVPLTIFSYWLFRTRGGNSAHVFFNTCSLP